MTSTEELDRFWAKVKIQGADECWPWTAGIYKQTGYGVFHPTDGPQTTAHAFIHDQVHGAPPPDFHRDHKCHNDTDCPGGRECQHRRCCNPRHLEAVHRTENVNRSHRSNLAKTHCPAGHEYTPENTRLQVKKNTTCRKCIQCERDRGHNRRSS